MEKINKIFEFEKSLQISEKYFKCAIEWNENIVTSYDNTVHLTTENVSREIFNLNCCSLVIWNGNLVCGGSRGITIWNSDQICI